MSIEQLLSPLRIHGEDNFREKKQSKPPHTTSDHLELPRSLEYSNTAWSPGEILVGEIQIQISYQVMVKGTQKSV